MEDVEVLRGRQNRRSQPWATDSDQREPTMAEVFGPKEGARS
jgi:hypothetical protein